MARIELNDQNLEEVVGGAFNISSYTNDDGSEYLMCHVDGAGTYHCSADAKRKLCLYIVNYVKNNGAEPSIQQVVDQGFALGVFWN